MVSNPNLDRAGGLVLIQILEAEARRAGLLDDSLNHAVDGRSVPSGGSGGPLFNRDGKVIGVNFATPGDFGGSNLAVPVRYADALVK
jgi:S1-C subfamily serine protease